MSSSPFNMLSATLSLSPKIYFTHSEISSKYLDPSQPPTKAVPFRQIRDIPFVKNVKICTPTWLWKELYPESDSVTASTSNSGPPPELKYSNVTMTLKDVLNNETLRRGNYCLLSTSTTTTISLNSGKLTITMPQHIYQRAGLTFPTTRLPNGARKHEAQSALHRIEVDLRQPSMVKGKKGFDRLVYAATNVEGLKDLRSWLFCDLSEVSGAGGSSGKKRKRDGNGETQTVSRVDEKMLRVGTGASEQVSVNGGEDGNGNAKHEHLLSKFNSSTRTTRGTKRSFEHVLIPPFVRSSASFSTIQSQAASQNSQKANLPTILEEDIYDVVEYLSLLFLQSPRVVQSEYGKIDPYLCQYVLPELTASLGDKSDDDDDRTGEPAENLNIVSYSGFMPSSFVTQLLVDIIRRSRSNKTLHFATDAWLALSIVAHPAEGIGGSDGLMVLLQTKSITGSHAADIVSEQTDEVVAVTKDSDTQNVSGIETEPDSMGLGSVTCFEFLDSVIG